MTQPATRVIEAMMDHVRVTSEALSRLDLGRVAALIDRLEAAYAAGQRVFLFGNGGSAAAASHFAEDLAKGILSDMGVQQRLRVHSLVDSSPMITALGNDCGYETVFREQLVTLASPGDVAIAISGSGNSPNVLRAMEWARDHGVHRCGLTGFDGGKLSSLVDIEIRAPIADMEVAENCHMIVIHLVIGGLRRRLQERSSSPRRGS